MEHNSNQQKLSHNNQDSQKLMYCQHGYNSPTQKGNVLEHRNNQGHTFV